MTKIGAILSILTRLGPRVFLSLALAACGSKSKSHAQNAAPPGGEQPANEDPTSASPPPPISVPADITGSYLTCAQTDETGSAVPSQDDHAAGETELLFGCAVAKAG